MGGQRKEVGLLGVGDFCRRPCGLGVEPGQAHWMLHCYRLLCYGKGAGPQRGGVWDMDRTIARAWGWEGGASVRGGAVWWFMDL